MPIVGRTFGAVAYGTLSVFVCGRDSVMSIHIAESVCIIKIPFSV